MKGFTSIIPEFYVRGAHMWSRKAPAIVPICYMNSYYNAKNIQWMIKKASDNSERVYVFVPSDAALHTYRAIGMQNHDARWRTKTRWFHRHLSAYCMYPNVKIVDWTRDVETHDGYIQKTNELLRDEEFCKRFSGLTKKVMNGYVQNAGNHGVIIQEPSEASEEQITEGFVTFAKDISFFHNSSEILGESEVVVCSYKPQPEGVEEYMPESLGGIVLKK